MIKNIYTYSVDVYLLVLCRMDIICECSRAVTALWETAQSDGHKCIRAAVFMCDCCSAPCAAYPPHVVPQNDARALIVIG